MRRTGALWVLGLIACSGAPTPQLTAREPCSVHDMQTKRVGGTNRALTVHLSVVEVCSGRNETDFHHADKVAVEVFDPNGDAFPFTVSGPHHVGSATEATTSADVTFTPDKAGTWRVTAAFEPSVGRVTMTVPVVNYGDESSFRLLPAGALPNDCDRIGLTGKGALICGRTGIAEVVTDKGQRFESAQATVLDGDLLWVVTGDQLERWVEKEPGLFVKTHEKEMRTRQVLVAPATKGGLWLSSRNPETPRLSRITPVADGTLAVVTTEVNGFAPESMAADGDRLMLAGATEFVVLGPGDAIARIPLPLDGRISVGADGPVMWTANAIRGLGALTVVDGKLLSTSFSLSLVSSPTPTLGTFIPSIPLMAGPQTDISNGWFVAVPVLEAGEIQLTAYSSTYEFGVIGASLRHVFSRSMDGKTVKVIDR